MDDNCRKEVGFDSMRGVKITPNSKNTVMAHESHFAEEQKSNPTSMQDSERTSPCFDCNICLDFVRDPVVTLCGHLYCWPCIYKWFFVQTSSLDSDENPNCPVCKSKISHTTVVPLYGRGQTKSETESEVKSTHQGLTLTIPPRPPACGTRALLEASNASQQLPHQGDPHRSYYGEDYSSPFYHDGNGGTTSSSTSTSFSFNSNVGMFGEMIYARVFGNSESLYAYPNSYHLAGNSNPRLRRLEMQAHKSLNRVTIFLTCCLVLCLLLF